MATKALAVSITSILNKNIFTSTRIISCRMMSTADQNDVLVQEIDDKGIITLNRPKALNSLNLSMVQKLYPLLKKWEKEKSLVIIKGAGEKAFCAGGDVKAVIQAGLKGEKLGHDFFRSEYLTNGLIGSYSIPYIALIDGITMGGGVGLSVHGKYRVATERTLFAMPETQIGLFPDVGGSYFLPRLQGKLGYYLALSGVRLKGFDVYKAGIATHYVESTEISSLEKALLKCTSPKTVDKTLGEFHKELKQEFSLAPYLVKINECFSGKTIEEILSKLESDDSKWAKDTQNLLQKMSPTSLKVTLKELEVGSKLSLPECLIMEYRLAIGCLNNKDFYEGVRALLIDKDQQPKWNPQRVQDVSEDLVNSFFSKPQDVEDLRHKL